MLLSLSLLNQWSATALAVAHKTAKAVLLQLLLKSLSSARLVYFYRSHALRRNDIRHSLFRVKLTVSRLMPWSATALAVAHKTAKAVLLQLLLKFLWSSRLVYFYRSHALRGNDIRHSLFRVKLTVSRLMPWSATALAVAHKTAKAVLLQLLLKSLSSARLVYFYRSHALRGNDIRHSLFRVKLILSRLMPWSATALAVAHKTAKAVLLQLLLKFLGSARLVY